MGSLGHVSERIGRHRLGGPFPRFELHDLDGRLWSADDLAGARTVVFCFASWCACRDQLPKWQAVWEERARSFRLLGVAQEALGDERIREIVADAGITFPVLVDRSSFLAAELGFRVVPTGFFVDAAGRIACWHFDDFDIVDPRVRMSLDAFLAGEPVESPPVEQALSPAALALFGAGVALSDEGDDALALQAWRAALELDPDNFLIRSQIWVAERPDRFYPVVDRDWQSAELIADGYEKPLP
jgi:peroxiredoxin